MEFATSYIGNKDAVEMIPESNILKDFYKNLDIYPIPYINIKGWVNDIWVGFANCDRSNPH